MSEKFFRDDHPAVKVTEAAQAEAFAEALRNPVERAVLVVSGVVQRALKAICRLLPD